VSESQHAPVLRLPSLHVPAPRVRFTQAECGHQFEPIVDEAEDPAEFRNRFIAALGTTEHSIAETLFQEILNVLRTDPSKPFDAATANLVLALLHRIGPKDELEAMLVGQMIIAHLAAMDVSRRALHVEQTPGGRHAYLSLARKLMTLFTGQMDTLNRHRGKLTVQKVVVEKVLVAPGGQAVVGAVSSGRRGDG
jgi:hypothetical protein